MAFEINEVTVHEGQGGAFETAFAAASRELRNVQGCRSVALLRRLGEANRYQVRIEWARLEDHVEHYPLTAEAVEVRALLGPLIATIERGHYDAVSLG